MREGWPSPCTFAWPPSPSIGAAHMLGGGIGGVREGGGGVDRVW